MTDLEQLIQQMKENAKALEAQGDTYLKNPIEANRYYNRAIGYQEAINLANAILNK